MASGGWLGNIISLPMKILGSVMGAGSHSYTPQNTQVKASDLVSSTTAETADAPVMGSDTTYGDGTTKKKKRGLSQLYAGNSGGIGSTSDYTGRSGL